MVNEKHTIIPAKFIGLDNEGNYRVLCYYGFNQIKEKTINEHLINKKSDYYLIATSIKNNRKLIHIEPANEYEELLKEKYETI